MTENKRFYKKVLLPIEVCVGDYCWGGKAEGETRICPHFDNEGGHATCDMGFILKSDKTGQVPKPEKCLRLSEEKVVLMSEDLVNLSEFLYRDFSEDGSNRTPTQGLLELLIFQWIRKKKGFDLFKGVME